MDLDAIAITVAAGVLMGAINNLAGGAGVFGLMAFEHGFALPLAAANPSMRPAALCVGLFAYLGYRRAGHTVPWRTWRQSLWAVPGAPIGGWLALTLPDLVFWSYLIGVLALLFWQQSRRTNSPPRRTHSAWLAVIGCFLVGVHMGYAQVGVGLLTTLVLTATSSRSLIEVTAAKSTIVILTSIASIASLGAANAIVLGPALCLACGTAIGSYYASRWAVARGPGALRIVVLIVTAATLVYATIKAWAAAT